MRLLPRYIPNTSMVLMGLDAASLSLADILILGQIYQRLEITDLFQLTLIILLSLASTMMFLYASGTLQRDALINPGAATSRISVALILSAVVTYALLNFGLWSLFPGDGLYRSVSRCGTIVLTLTGLSFCALTVSRSLFQFLVRRHLFRRRVLVVGRGRRALYLRNLLRDRHHDSIVQPFFVPEILLGPNDTDRSSDGDAARAAEESGLGADLVDVAGRSLLQVSRDLRADEIILAADERRGLRLEVLLACKAGGVPVTDLASFLERETGRVDLRWVETSWLIYSPGFEMGMLDRVMKRTLDIVVSLLGLLAAFPLLLAAALAIRWEGPGSILFRQQRVTLEGRVFWLFKLRTMRTDAEIGGAQWAATNDSRITRVGAFLRRTRIDEVPQLFNVLNGDMSFVGPRPERPVFTEQLARHIQLYDLRHCVKAGLTGWAQINYPYGASIEDARCKLEYDLYYIKNFNFIRDLMIILRTLRVVIWPDGVR